MASEPRPLSLTRNLDVSVYGERELQAECDQWECDIDGHGRVEFGKSVSVPALCFDESDGDAIRRLSAWLLKAAAWVEADKK
jgi:hypothetical protein